MPVELCGRKQDMRKLPDTWLQRGRFAKIPAVIQLLQLIDS
jgi:hypothetical protein